MYIPLDSLQPVAPHSWLCGASTWTLPFQQPKVSLQTLLALKSYGITTLIWAGCGAR